MPKIIALVLAATLAACATKPVDLTPPPKKPLDAKTTLESGRKS